MTKTFDVSLVCDDLDAAIEWYSGKGGFALEAIFPADAPRRATLYTEGIRLALESRTRRPAATSPPALVVTRSSTSSFGEGRAGMQYRDLVPGRFGGLVIASHIRIPEGGPVPDYVHHHDVGFQVICCVRGWVRVVYEDQGDALLLTPGDCFLQPPHIRHRVLECSDMMEVVEIASPAEHMTLADHDMALPTGRVDGERSFGGQRFVHHEASHAAWDDSGVPGIELRDSGIADASAGAVSVVALRSSGDAAGIPLAHDGDIRFLFLTAGSAILEGDVVGAGDAIAVPPNYDVALTGISAGFEAIEISAPSRIRGR